MKLLRKWKFVSFIISAGISTLLMGGTVLTANAEVIDYRAQAEAHRLMPVESNQIKDWPQGPAVSAESAILLEANTGTVLYAKNIHQRLYPASTTKILTAYIARQKGNLSDLITYSPEAVNSINWREDSNIGIKAGEAITLEQSLYGLMVGSANECGNAIGEYISGSMEAFVDLMNETAKELGCTDSHFVTTNGIHDDEHYTSAHDLALIAQQYFADELLCKMSGQKDYVLPESPTLSQQLIPFSKNKLLPGKAYAYEYLVGSKTGYTDKARQNLVSCAEKDGLKLICVVMNDESPMQYTDTIDLFNYGFSNFKAVNAAENDTAYNINSDSFFTIDHNIFGDSAPVLSMDENAYVILPSDASFENVKSVLSYDDAKTGQAAVVNYSYSDQPVGSAAILFSGHADGFDFNAQPTETASDEAARDDAARTNAAETNAAVSAAAADDTAKGDTAVRDKNAAAPGKNILFLDLQKIGMIAGIILIIILLVLIIRSVLINRRNTKRRRDIMNRRRNKKDDIIDFDKYTDHF